MNATQRERLERLTALGDSDAREALLRLRIRTGTLTAAQIRSEIAKDRHDSQFAGELVIRIKVGNGSLWANQTEMTAEVREFFRGFGWLAEILSAQDSKLRMHTAGLQFVFQGPCLLLTEDEAARVLLSILSFKHHTLDYFGYRQRSCESVDRYNFSDTARRKFCSGMICNQGSRYSYIDRRSQWFSNLTEAQQVHNYLSGASDKPLQLIPGYEHAHSRLVQWFHPRKENEIRTANRNPAPPNRASRNSPSIA